MKTGGVLALCSFKTRAEKKARKTEEFYKITSLIASVELSPGILNSVNFGLVGWNLHPSRN